LSEICLIVGNRADIGIVFYFERPFMLCNVLKATLTDSKESVGKDRSENEAIAAGVHMACGPHKWHPLNVYLAAY
jgi:hypothetical protein